MTRPHLKHGYYVLEGINAFATAYYFNYLFFFMQARFGYGNFENLLLSAANGFVYMIAAWWGGRFAQRFGCFSALWLGFGTMCLVLGAGSLVRGLAGQWLVMGAWTVGMCFTWPALEALVSEGENERSLPRRIGIYNLTWAGGSGLAYFTGGAVLEHLGGRSLFLVPAALHLAQIVLLACLQRVARQGAGPSPEASPSGPIPARRVHRDRARNFLLLAWLANPFAYVAINTIIAVIPALAKRHDLSPTWAGFFCSLWFFARMGAFAILWHWPGWHYRFRWFAIALFLMPLSFVVILLSPTLWPVMVAQVVFGGAIGLIYYSSLFYSMDVGETKGEHGGIHEAAIGAGIFAGPGAGAVALAAFPGHPAAGAWGVAGLLLAGGTAILALRWRAWRRERGRSREM